jgi:sulfoxide reductase heme-binding subunit YedZ
MTAWDVARASAFVAFGCYTMVVAWGIGLSSRFWRPPASHLSYHRFLSTVGLMAVMTHVAALMIDRYAKVTPRTLVGLDPRPGVVLGAAALWLVVVLPLSIRLRKARWISQRTWRGLHYFGYAVWALSLAHGVLSGTDARSPFALALYALSASIIAAAAWYRWAEQPQRPAHVPVPVPAEAEAGE